MNRFGGRCSNRINNWLLREINIAGRGLLTGIKRIVLHGFACQQRHRLDKDRRAPAIADRSMAIADIVAFHELLRAAFSNLIGMLFHAFGGPAIERLKHGHRFRVELIIDMNAHNLSAHSGLESPHFTVGSWKKKTSLALLKNLIRNRCLTRIEAKFTFGLGIIKLNMHSF